MVVSRYDRARLQDGSWQRVHQEDMCQAFGIPPRTVTVFTSGTATLTVATTDDSTDEADGSVTATVTDGTGYRPDSSAATATVNVIDDDNSPPPPSAAAPPSSPSNTTTNRTTISLPTND